MKDNRKKVTLFLDEATAREFLLVLWDIQDGEPYDIPPAVWQSILALNNAFPKVNYAKEIARRHKEVFGS
jgi:hypothetical protein